MSRTTTLRHFSGRAVVTNMSQQRLSGGDALLMYEPGVTCLDIESFSIHDGERAIMEMLEPENQLKYNENAYRRFHDIVNYDEEGVEIKKFMENLL